jgi:hypothetical protein
VFSVLFALITVKNLATISPDSTIHRGFGKVHFSDTYQIEVHTDNNADQILRELMRLPRWAGWLLALRNAIVGVFGLKVGRPQATFPVMWQTESEVVTGLCDRHLDFRVSILKEPCEGIVSFTTIVRFNNRWGRIYFAVIRPFHKLIVKTLMRRFLAHQNSSRIVAK